MNPATHLSSAVSAEAPTTKCRVFVVEDHPFMRRSIVAAIERECTLAVCGQADDAGDAFSAIGSLAPDIVLTDLELKSSSGFDLIRNLQRSSPKLPVVATTIFDVSANGARALAAGAAAFVAKQEGPEAMIKAILDLVGKLPGSVAGDAADSSASNN